MSEATEAAPLLPPSSSSDAVSHSHIKHWSWKPTRLRAPHTSSLRGQVQRFLTSRIGHYSVLLLVGLDVSAIFADLLLNIFECERSCSGSGGRDGNGGIEQAQEVLGIVSLVFSCLFMLELLASVWAFRWSFFKSYFHCFDAAVILAAFVVDVLLKGVLEEAGAIVVVLRFWRVFKIIEEFSAGAEEQMDSLSEHIEKLISENKELKKRIAALQESEHPE